MPVGIEIWNDAGVPITTDLSFNLCLIGSGTISVGSNTEANGTSAAAALPAKGRPYVVFIRCNGNATILRTDNAGFVWFMAQGTTSFQWYAYNQPDGVSNVGMQIFNSDGSLRWDLGLRPLQVTSVITPGSGPSWPGELSTANVLDQNLTFGIPNGSAIALSDPGYMLDLYTGVPGRTITPNMRYWPCINTSAGNVVRINYGRRFSNRVNPLPSGVNWNTFFNRMPTYILTAPGF